MDFESFEKEFLSYLQKNDKKHLKKIEKNTQEIETYLERIEKFETFKRFVEKINDTIILQKKFSFFEKLFRISSFRRLYPTWINSEALIKACKKGNKNACEWLLKMNINPCIQDENGMTALMYAVKKTSLIPIVKELISEIDCLNILDKEGNNALFHSIHNTEILNLLLFSGINVNNINKNGETVILYCCKYDLFAPIKCITLNKDLNVNIPDSEGRTAFMYLAEKRRYPEMIFLNRRNCDINFVNKRNESALSVILKRLYRRDTKSRMVSDYIHIIYYLIQMNFDFNIPLDEDGNTAIMYFMLVNDPNSFRFVLSLIKNNINLSISNHYGESVYSLALKLKNNYYLRYLMNEFSFDFGYTDPIYNNTVLMLASMTKTSFIKEILENDINMINAVNKRNENALILATKANQIRSVALLLKYGIHVNQQDDFGNTSLYYAVDINNPIIIRLLLTHHASINIKNGEGKSVIDLVCEKGDKSILKLFSDPTPVSEEEIEQENRHPPCIKYEEIIEYTSIYIKYYNDNNFEISEDKNKAIINTCIQIKMEDNFKR